MKTKILTVLSVITLIIVLIGCAQQSVTTKAQETVSSNANQNTPTASKPAVGNNTQATTTTDKAAVNNTSTVPIKTVNLIEIDGVTNLKFKDMVGVEQLKKLDNKKVSMSGFMGASSPLDGSYMYLMNIPYQTCVFCLPNDKQLTNTMAVYAPEGKSFKFTDIPVKVTGTLVFDNTSDSKGYTYGYRIINAKVEKANIDGMEKQVKIYTGLVDQGFSIKINKDLEKIYQASNYEQLKIPETDVKPIDLTTVKELKAMFNSLNKADYTDIYSTVEKLEKLHLDINKAIEAKNWAEVKGLNTKGQEVYNEFYRWLVKPEL